MEEDFELEDWENLDIETVKFTFDQSEKYLNDTIKTAQFQAKRATVALQAIISLLIIIVGFLASGFEGARVLIHLGWLSIGILFILLFDAFKAYNLYRVLPLGNLPSNIISKKNIDFAQSKQRLFILYNCLRTIQDSINYNENQNNERARLIHILYRGIKYGLITVTLYPLLYWLVFQFVFESLGVGF